MLDDAIAQRLPAALEALHERGLDAAYRAAYAHASRMRHFPLLQQSQYWPPAQVDRLVRAKLARIVDHACRAVPFYGETFARLGLTSADIRAPADLRKLPPLTRADLQTRGMQLRACPPIPGAKPNHSGGSTGHPVTVYQDGNYRAWAGSDLERCYRMAGYWPGARVAFMWGSDYDSRRHTGVSGKLFDRLVLNLLWVNTFDLREDDSLDAYRRLLRFRPRVLVGYVSSLTLVARLVRERALPPLGVAGIQASAEQLSDADRELIAMAFGGPVFNRYGSREVSNIAHECEQHAGLHVLLENNIVELVDDDGRIIEDERPGQVLVTNLNNFAMPLIRYAIGDVAAWRRGACDCGRSLPRLDRVLGRQSDTIRTPGGKLLHGEFFSHLMYGVPGIRQFQVRQISADILVVSVVASEAYADSTAERLAGLIRAHGDSRFAVRVERVDRIVPTASGKYRFVIGF